MPHTTIGQRAYKKADIFLFFCEFHLKKIGRAKRMLRRRSYNRESKLNYTSVINWDR